MSQGHLKVSPGTFQDQPRDIYLCPCDISRLAQGHLKVSPGTSQDQLWDIYYGSLKIGPGTHMYASDTNKYKMVPYRHIIYIRLWTLSQAEI